ncbi:hypothetical protein [Thiobacillus denitrificans]|uniref:Large polyvalent protein associated domain-containing protein n=1 Tax=Thiobacillus denitrificans TaxID=36861 RepID=A0A106BIY4_THIDE|nr:hypothetical protein [Thiobacillus denitrificans]KVW93336.1 hypothetical protein ABW22_14485 [Thiobacillus denitrificans]
MDLDELMDRSTQPVAAPDTVDDAMDAYSGAQTGAVRAGATLALDSNPDEIARQKRIAQSLGVPLAAVEADPEFATREQRVRSIEQATANSPALRQKFSDADFAKLAADNVDNLSGIEQLLRSAKRGFTAGLRGMDAAAVDDSARILTAIDTIERGGALSPNDPLASMFAGSGRSPDNLAQMRAKHQGRVTENVGEYGKRTQALTKLQPTGATADFYQAKGWGDSLSALLSDPFEISANVATESLGLMAPALPMIAGGGLAGGARGLAGMAGATSTNAEYSTAIAEALQASGVDLNNLEAVQAAVATPEFAETRRQATIKAATIGAFDAATAGMAGVRLRPSMAGNLAAQTGVQATGGAAGEVAGSVASGQEVNASSVLAEAIGEMPSAMIDVAMMAGKRTLEGQRKADQAEQQGAFIKNLNKLAAADKLLARDPETFQSFIAAVAEDGPVQNVFIDGRTLMQSGMAPRLAELSPAVLEQLDRAILTGGVIAIPVDEYAARIAPTEFAPQLLDHLKTDVEGFSRAEAADFMANQGAELKAEFERVIGTQSDADTFRASHDVVKQDIIGQLNTAARFTPQVNDAYATLVAARTAVRAAQMGMTPEAFHQKYGMNARGAEVAGDKFDQAGVSFKEGSRGSRSGQTDMTLTADAGGESVGRIDYSVYQGRPSVQMIDVPEGKRRKGYATEMVKQLQRQFPGVEIDFGGLTEEGAALYKALAKTTEPSEYAPAFDELAAAIAERTALEEKNAQLEGTAERGAWIAQVGDRWNELHDIISDLEGEIFNKSPTKNLINTFDPADPSILNQSANRSLYEKAWKMLAGNEAIFQNPMPDSFDMEGAAREIDPGMSAVADKPDLDEQKTGITKKWYVTMPDGTHAYVMENKQGEVWLDASRLEEGASGGAKLYLLVGSYAEGNGKVFIGDPAGLSDVALIRRTENMLSLALRFGKTSFMRPHEYQMNPDAKQGTVLAGVVKPLEWVEGNDANNIEELIRTSYANTVKLVAEVKDVTFNFDKQRFEQDGVEFTKDGFKRLVDGLPGALRKRGLSKIVTTRNPGGKGGAAEDFAPIGIATLKRAAVTNTLARETRAGRGGDLLAEIGRFVSGELTGLAGTLYQPGGGNTAPRGSFSPATNTVTLLQNADLSTFLHESAHYFFESDIQLASELAGKAEPTPGEQQIVDDVSRLLTWHGINGDVTEQLRTWHTMDFEEQRSHHERTAESFEAYLFSGQAPSLELQPMFQRFRAWMVNVYKSIKDFLAKNPEAGKLNNEVRSVFDRMIATQEQIQLAEQARSLTALFASPETSGMTADAFAAYQALGTDATNTAIEQLQAKGLRDMQWLTNARGREIKKLQKESKAARAEVTMEARGEVMRQPVYRAWDFLTRKLSDNDKLPPLERKSDPDVLDPTLDSLFVAIAKLGGIRKDQVLSEWGADPKDIPQSGLFGKPVWRVTEGLPIDSMASALAEHGYLPLNEHGQYELNDLGDRFLAELSGDTQYSHAYQPQDLLPGEQIATPDGLMAGRIEFAGLAAIGIPEEIAAHLKTLKMTATDGLHPDLVAVLFEFSSGDELVRTLAAAPTPKDAINALAEQMMLERFGELSSPDAIERAADQAIHNDVRARMLTTEVNALAQATGKPKILASAAKAFAADMIARLKVRDVRPGQYANAEARAAKAAAKAKGDIATAAAEKRNQVIQHYATSAAYDAQDEVKATLRAWSKLVARKDSTKSVDIDLLNAVRAILGEYGIAPKRAERASEYLKSVQAYDPEMYAVIQASVERAEANAKPVKELTLDQFRGLRDEIDSIMHLAKRSRQMEIDGDLLEIADIQDALVERMTDYGIPETIPGEGQAVTPAEQRMNKFKSLLAFARRVESWVGQMDGTQQMGPFRRFVWSRISDAAVAYRVDKAAYMKQFRALVESIAPTLKPALIHSPELGYTFGKDSGGSAINEILHAVLHTGNESNKRKMLLGRGWAVEVAPGQLDTTRWNAFIARLVAEGKLTPAHYDFAQGAWDLLESMKPLAQKTHRDVFGRYFNEVTANPFTDPFGVTRAGGYVPAMVDSRIVKDAELRKLADEDNAAMSYAFPTTPKGFTQARTEYNKPLMLDLRTLGQHVDKVLLFSHMEMPVREVQRVLSKRVGETLNRIDQTAISGMLLPWLNRSAKQQVETPIAGSAGTMRFFSVLRSHAGMAAMFGNLANTVQQLTGFSLAAIKVKPSLLLAATVDFTKAPREFAQAVSETSAYMNTRMANEVYAMTDAINDILLNPSLLEKGQAWTMRHAYFLQSAFDNSMSPIIWTAAYNQAKQGGETHADAVRLADGTVRETQGAMQAEDIARFEGGNAFVRMFTQFAGYFNMNANLLGTGYAQLMHNGGLRKNAGRGVFLFVFGFMIPAVVGELIIQLFRGGPGDDDDDGEYLDDWIAAVFGWAPLRYATAMVPIAGQVVNAAVNSWNSKPYDDRLASSPAISMLESAARAPVSVYKAIDGDGSAQKAVRDVATLMSMTLGLPANLAARPIGYGVGVMDDATDPTSGFDFARGILTGQVSPDSKQ